MTARARCAAAVTALGLTGLATAPAGAQPAPVLPPVLQKHAVGAPCAAYGGGSVSGVPWAEEYLGVGELSQRATGAGVTVGLVDTGTDLTRDPALAARVQQSVPAYGTKTSTHDCVGHGTAMASLIAGSDHGVQGLAPGARIVAIKATDDDGNTDGAHLAQAITHVVDAGATIVAVGTAVSTDSADLRAAVRHALAKGALVIAPSRFDFQSQDGAVYPAADTGVLSVADVGPGGELRSDIPTGAPVDLAAPGDLLVASGRGGTGQVTASGPSYAVAYVAAAAALVEQYHPGLTGTQIAQRLLAGATPPASGAAPDATVGAGVLDPSTALDVALGTSGRLAPAATPRLRAARPTDTGLPAATIVSGAAGVVVVLVIGVAGSVAAYRRRTSPA